MAPLAPNNTSRLKVHYIANEHAHTVQFRYADAGAPPSAVLEAVDDFLISMNGLMPTDWAFTGWGYIPEGGTFETALSGAPTTFAGTGTQADWKAPAYVSFVGSALGRRVRVYLLGANFTPDQAANANDYRVTSTENGSIDAAVDALNVGAFVTIGGDFATFKPYANLGFNRHWQDEVRT